MKTYEQWQAELNESGTVPQSFLSQLYEARHALQLVMMNFRSGGVSHADRQEVAVLTQEALSKVGEAIAKSEALDDSGYSKGVMFNQRQKIY